MRRQRKVQLIFRENNKSDRVYVVCVRLCLTSRTFGSYDPFLLLRIIENSKDPLLMWLICFWFGFFFCTILGIKTEKLRTFTDLLKTMIKSLYIISNINIFYFFKNQFLPPNSEECYCFVFLQVSLMLA